MIDAVVEIIEDVGDLAEALIGQHGRGDEIAAAAPVHFRSGEQRRDGVAGMAGAMGERDESVVEIEIAEHGAVGEGGEIGAGLGAADQHGRRLFCADVAGKLDRDPARTGAIAAEGAADGVENGAFDDAHDIVGDVLVFQTGSIAGERLGEHGLRCGFLFRQRRQRRHACGDAGRRHRFEEIAAGDIRASPQCV